MHSVQVTLNLPAKYLLLTSYILSSRISCVLYLLHRLLRPPIDTCSGAPSFMLLVYAYHPNHHHVFLGVYPATFYSLEGLVRAI